MVVDKVRYRQIIQYLFSYWNKNKNFNNLEKDVFNEKTLLDDKPLTENEIQEISLFSKKSKSIKQKIIKLLINWNWERLGVFEKILMLYFGYRIITDSENKKMYIDIALQIGHVYCKKDSFRIINGILDNIEDKKNKD